MTRGAVVLDGSSLTLDDVRAVARDRVAVQLTAEARAHMLRTRSIVEEAADSGAAVYGVNTGFGTLSEVSIAREQVDALQVNVIRSHAAGVGDPMPAEETRAMMLLRANVLAGGRAGARPGVAELLCEMLNAGLHPVVPEQGSVGASGDLAPLAHLALPLIGEGELFHAGSGRRGPATDVLRAAGLSPIRLGPKEGISLINGTQAHTAIAALLCVDARAIWASAQVAGAMSLEALLGTPVAFDERIHEARGQRGQERAAAVLRSLLAGSEIRESHRAGDPRVQDAYSLRCIPQVHGAVLDALDWVEAMVARELNAATDNPLVFDDGAMLSGGNFHGQPVALALDVLAIALSTLATMSERRTDRLVHPDFNQGLPAFLAPDPGLHSGFMMAQVTAAALASECKLLAHPASVDSIPTDGSKEDIVPMAMGAALKARRVVENVRHVVAIELMCAAQGVDYRAPLRAGAGVISAHRAVRQSIPTLGDDRVLSGDIATIAELIRAGTFMQGEPA
ncbi:MAG TPA: histidine ammonia-lyase [Gemmatimonadaceae bacterium]|nr:histidine ammonia-lyase [Gemmatimonadaceae bacterium]